jgi:hypothetical protein
MLTTEQLATLKTAILADPVLAAYPNTLDGAFDMCRDKLNVEFAPAYTVWQDQLTPDLYDAGLISGGATQIDGLTPGKRDLLFLIGARTRNCNTVAVRSAIDDACGSANALKTAMLAAQKRNATYGEKIFSTGTGTVASPATLVVYGAIDYNDVVKARAS